MVELTSFLKCIRRGYQCHRSFQIRYLNISILIREFEYLGGQQIWEGKRTCLWANENCPVEFGRGILLYVNEKLGSFLYFMVLCNANVLQDQVKSRGDW